MTQSRVGETVYHRELGECRIGWVHADGSLTVVSATVFRGVGYPGGCNVFRLRRPERPERWEWSVER